MTPASPSWFRRYAVAVLATALGVGLRELLGPVIAPTAFLTFYPFVPMSAAYGGLGPGLLTTLLSVLVGGYLYLPPLNSASVEPNGLVRIAIFTAISTAATWVVNRRRQHQSQITVSEARLRRMVEADMIGVIFWDRDGNVPEANDHFLRLVGYSRDDLRAGRVRWNKMTPPEFEGLDAEALRQIDTTGAYVPFERELIRRDGSRVPVLIAGAATTEERDKGVSLVLDISEQKRVEDALRLAKKDLEARVAERTAALLGANARLEQELAERQRMAAALQLSEERHRLISELTSDYAYRIDIDENGRMTFAWQTGAFSRITGFQPEEIRNMSGLWDLFHPHERNEITKRLDRLAEGRPGVSEFRLRTKSGEYRWLREHTRPEIDPASGRVIGVLGAAQDITERKLAEEALRLSEERFALAVAGANDGVWDWKIDTNELYLSPRWKDIIGFSEAEMDSDIVGLMGRVHSADLERVADDVRNHLAGRTPLFRSEYRMRHRDDGYRWVLARGIAVRDASGHAYRMAGSLTDMTPRKQAEQDASRRQAELAHALRLSTLGEMAAGLAHELNQPLTAIVTYARSCELRIQAGETKSDALRHAIGQVAKQGLRAGDILQRYRGFVRSGPARREWVDLNALAREVAQLTKAVADEERISIRLELAGAVPEVLGDGVQIEQVLVNLIRNGLESMHGSNGAELAVYTRVVAGEVEVAVRDAGRGIAEEVRERLFDAFVTTKSDGLGMGLSISRSIIEAHGGRLWSASNAGAGTTFYFTVPLPPVMEDREPSPLP